MKVGTAQLDITPKTGIDLAGFAKRPQPSTQVRDPLWVRALYLEHEAERMIWLHADLLGFDQQLADRLRSKIARELCLPVSHVVVSASHTHSGPAVIQLTDCGQVDLPYVSWLETQCVRVARSAVERPEACELVVTEGRCDLGADRRCFASAHTDSRVGAVGWRRPDGSFKAVFLNYAMHPVCLRDSQFSADWPGEAARVLSQVLPGNPIVLVSPGACGNINPPAVGVEHRQMSIWGCQVAEAVAPGLLAGRSKTLAQNETLKITGESVILQVDFWNADQIEEHAAFCRSNRTGFLDFGDSFGNAIETWRRTMINQLNQGRLSPVRAELGVIWFGAAALVTVNAEIFSKFTGLAALEARCPVYTVSCANGMIGYVPSAKAYDEGAYEVYWAMLFYNLSRVSKGSLESLAAHARRLIAACEKDRPALVYDFQSNSGTESRIAS